jgi:hypothetical protein
MLAFMKVFLSFLTLVLEHFQNKGSKLRETEKTNQNKKALAYENLRKALDARGSFNRSSSVDDIMSDDGYRRKE